MTKIAPSLVRWINHHNNTGILPFSPCLVFPPPPLAHATSCHEEFKCNKKQKISEFNVQSFPTLYASFSSLALNLSVIINIFIIKYKNKYPVIYIAKILKI